MPKLTIHTATYNRAYILGKAYESLKAQTCKDFEWIITDDGSTDNTEDLVKGWQNLDNGFPIYYYKLNHVGIPRALNNGVNHSHSEWFMMLDSDDMIIPYTIEKVLEWLDEIKDMPKMAGVGFAKCHPDGEYMKKQQPLIADNSYVDASHIERKKYHINMDMCEVHRTALFLKYPFQFWPTEKYAPEQLNFNEIALSGWKLRWRKDKMYVCDYLPDGQTRDNRLVKNNPMGFAMMYNQNILLSDSLKERLYNSMQMTALSIASNNWRYLFKSNDKFITLASLPLGLIIGIRRMIHFNKMK